MFMEGHSVKQRVHGLDQEWANYGPLARSEPLPVFVNKDLLEHGQTTCLLLPVAAFLLLWHS